MARCNTNTASSRTNTSAVVALGRDGGRTASGMSSSVSSSLGSVVKRACLCCRHRGQHQSPRPSSRMCLIGGTRQAKWYSRMHPYSSQHTTWSSWPSVGCAHVLHKPNSHDSATSRDTRAYPQMSPSTDVPTHIYIIYAIVVTGMCTFFTTRRRIPSKSINLAVCSHGNRKLGSVSIARVNRELSSSAGPA
jgi:hypothetical protein